MASESKRKAEIEKLLREVRRYRGLLEGSVYHLGEISSELFDLAQIEEGDLAGELDETLCGVQEEVQRLHDKLDGQESSEALDTALAEYRRKNPLKKAKKKATKRRRAA
jgi:signal transduction histidine kinase